MKPSIKILAFVFGFIIFLFSILYVGKINKNQNEEIKVLQKNIYDMQLAISVKDQPYIPDSIHFFGGTVPLYIYGVADDIDFWIKYYTAPKNRSRILLYLQKKEGYFPWIDSMLVKQNVSGDALYVSIAESELDPVVVSKAGAKGGWQFTRGTGLRNGLAVNNNLDERLHFNKSTNAACNELKSLEKEFKEFGEFESRMFALAAYNAGSGAVWRAIKKDNVRSYFLLMSLPKETERYIPRIIALKLILENPERYGFSKNSMFCGPNIRFVEYSATRFESWIQLAKRFSISVKEIKRANPYILNKDGIAKGVYTLQIPERKK